MFSKDQLELLEEILDTMGRGEMPQATADELKALRGIVRAAIWAIPRTLSKKDQAAIKAAEALGAVQIIGRNTSGILEPGASPPTRFKPEKIAAKTGDELLSALGL